MEGFGKLSSCTLLPVFDTHQKPRSGRESTRHQNQTVIKSHSGTVTFTLPADAKKCFDSIGKFFRVSPGGIQSSSHLREIAGCVVVSFANGLFDNAVKLIYYNAADANAVIKGRPFPHCVRATIAGYTPKSIEKLKAANKWKDDPTALILDDRGLIPINEQQGRAPVPAAAAALPGATAKKANRNRTQHQPPKFEVLLKFPEAIYTQLDERMVEQQLIAKRLPLPALMLVKRATPTDTEEAVAAAIFQTLVHPLVVKTYPFVDEKRLRGGFNLSVDKIEDVSTVAKSLEKLATDLKRFEQPVRVDEQYELAFSIHPSIWVAFEQSIEVVFQEAKLHQIAAHVPFKSEYKVVISLKSKSLPPLRNLKRKLDQILAVTYYTNAKKKVLFTKYGRLLLRALNDQNPAFHIDGRTQVR